jgi:hypothetical protein
VNGEPLNYILNGLRSYFIVVIVALLLVNAGLVNGDIMYKILPYSIIIALGSFHDCTIAGVVHRYVNRWNFAASSCILGLLIVVGLAVRGNPHERMTPPSSVRYRSSSSSSRLVI